MEYATGVPKALSRPLVQRLLGLNTKGNAALVALSAAGKRSRLTCLSTHPSTLAFRNDEPDTAAPVTEPPGVIFQAMVTEPLRSGLREAADS